MRKKPSFFLFPRWELFIPTLGTFYSHVGNNNSHVNLACMLRVCCVYVKARIVYVACMLRTPIFLVYIGVSSKIRVCCASFYIQNWKKIGFAWRNLWF